MFKLHFGVRLTDLRRPEEIYVLSVCESEGGDLHVSTGQHTVEGFGVPVDKDVAPRTENTSNNKGGDRKGSKGERRVRKSSSVTSVAKQVRGRNRHQQKRSGKENELG